MEETIKASLPGEPAAADSAPDEAAERKSEESVAPQHGRFRKPGDELQHARDRALVERAIAGDLEAFNEIVSLYQDYLFALVVRVVNDRDSAADAVQEAFFSCYRNLDRFRGDSFRSWLTRIALN
ncbi:MAG TPA: sigma factor, partial [Candidatus Limnocylindrales bacterium]|nr:sigma factor [Candidatus Limnocylindrales bacterium]